MGEATTEYFLTSTADCAIIQGFPRLSVSLSHYGMTSNGSTTSDITLQQVTAQPTLVVRLNIGSRDMGEVISHALNAVQEYLMRAQIRPVGPPFTRYLVMSDELKRAETGFPVEWAVEGSQLVVASQLPAGRVARMVYTGPYGGLMAAHNSIVDWIRGRGLTPAGGPIEIYLNDPETVDDASEYRTEIIWPIE